MRKKAADVLAALAQAERRGELHAFENAARQSSEDQLSRPAGGDLGYLSRTDLERQFGPELAEAAFALRAQGQTAGPLDTAQGVELIRLQARLLAINRTFADAKESLRGLLVRDRRQREYEDLVRRLRESAQVTIVDEALAKAPPPVDARK
jgi:peptidyl-prolyl cis-trans isomerase D